MKVYFTFLIYLFICTTCSLVEKPPSDASGTTHESTTVEPLNNSFAQLSNTYLESYKKSTKTEEAKFTTNFSNENRYSSSYSDRIRMRSRRNVHLVDNKLRGKLIADTEEDDSVEMSSITEATDTTTFEASEESDKTTEWKSSIIKSFGAAKKNSVATEMIYNAIVITLPTITVLGSFAFFLCYCFRLNGCICKLFFGPTQGAQLMTTLENKDVLKVNIDDEPLGNTSNPKSKVTFDMEHACVIKDEIYV